MPTNRSTVKRTSHPPAESEDMNLEDNPMPGTWRYLPWDVRFLILKEIKTRKAPGWASLASVCKEWQHIIAAENLRFIELDARSVSDFAGRIVQQKSFVRHIWLNVRLERYGCERCHKRVDRIRIKDDGRAFLNATKELFRILSKWPKSEHGLTLELNAYSVDDERHWFEGHQFATRAEEHPEVGTLHNCPNPEHYWTTKYAPPDHAISQVFWRIERPFSPSELPNVLVVTRFVLRRQMRRTISSVVLCQILGKLTSLEDFVYEHWKTWDKLRMKQAQIGSLGLIHTTLPPSLKRLCEFEDFNQKIDSIVAAAESRLPHHDAKPSARCDTALAAAFARRSLTLEHLSASFNIQAENFFASCQNDWVWSKLETLALTSKLLQCTTEPELIDDLLYKAGKTALRMPKLLKMVIWYGSKGEACAFSYEAHRDGSFLTWRGRWEMWNRDLGPDVVRAWRDVALRYSPQPLRIRQEWVADYLFSHGDAIQLLSLPVRVVEPTSLWGIRREGRINRRHVYETHGVER